MGKDLQKRYNVCGMWATFFLLQRLDDSPVFSFSLKWKDIQADNQGCHYWLLIKNIFGAGRHKWTFCMTE